MIVYNLLMDTESTNKSQVRKRKAALNASFCVKKERNKLYQKVTTLLQKPATERSKDEAELLSNSKDIVEQITLRKAQRQKLKERAQEYEDPSNILADKCKTLAEAVSNSKHLVVYTGAGISTAACIPDYRGSNGIWTLLQQGKDIGLHDLSRAEPTLTHMALYSLYRKGILKHVVSQNCDGLHLRSGIPRTVLSEVHGNMYLEVCSKCKPSNHYLRLFDVTEYTARYSHETLRLCYKCRSPLKDTIVHFGERGKLQWPLNWDTACKQADKADVILCLGSSLKVLKKYPWLWCMDKPVKKRPKLYIVNLQWTPKDNHSTLKINGKCDTVIKQIMSHLGLAIPQYARNMDPIFYHATVLHETEVHTTSRTPIEKDLSKSTINNAEENDTKDTQSKLISNTLENKDIDSISTKNSSVKTERELEASTNDLTSSINSSSLHIKQEPIENSSRDDSKECAQDTELKNNSAKICIDENTCSNLSSGISANIKKEPNAGDEIDVGKTVISNLNDVKIKQEVASENDDEQEVRSIDANSLDSVKEETSMDASSDKENFVVTRKNLSLAQNGDIKDESSNQSKKSAMECDFEIKIEKMVVEETDSGLDKQFNKTVISEKSSTLISSELTVQTFEETIRSTDGEEVVEVKNGISENNECNSTHSDSSNQTGQTNTNGLNLLCGRSLWSDLSVFDTLTNQPILFGRSILGWSDMNSFSYNSNTFTTVSDCSKNDNNQSTGEASSSSKKNTPQEDTKEKTCSFCLEHYHSQSCLFYVTSVPNIMPDTTSLCLCCGSDDEEDEQSQQQDDPEEEEDKTPAKVPNINPGWFGKGYRKKIKKRK